MTEHVTPEGSSAVLYAFQNDPDTHSTHVVLRGLDPGRVFELQSVDEGSLGLYSGQHLMTSGLDLYGSPNTAAQVFLLAPAAQATPAIKARTGSASAAPTADVASGIQSHASIGSGAPTTVR